MKNVIIKYTVLLILLFLTQKSFSQISIEPGEPPNNTNIPDFYRSRLTDIEEEIANMTIGRTEIIATSPGGLPVYAVYYGEKENFHPQANYNSAVGAGSPSYFARKGKDTKPVIFFLGPVHGQEIEGIVGLVNLLHVAETGQDHRGKEWPELKEYISKCRVIIIPSANPDGRRRCPYDSFVGLPNETMTKYGQGTMKDGTLWRWPKAKSVHPMKGNVGILGAYFNDDGINIMHDDFFFPMAKETSAILKVARDEVPDITVSLHSSGTGPTSVITQPAYEPWFFKERIVELSSNLNQEYKKAGLPFATGDWYLSISIEDKQFPPVSSFNLTSALHHVSGTMSFLYECAQGTTAVDRGITETVITHDGILDTQLLLYQEMFRYLLKNRLYWE